MVIKVQFRLHVFERIEWNLVGQFCYCEVWMGGGGNGYAFTSLGLS